MKRPLIPADPSRSANTPASSPAAEPDRTATNPTKLRHAEKSRESTCRFADLVAQASIAAYERVVPPSLRSSLGAQQTVLAAFLVLNDCGIGEDRLTVVSLGVGTKYMKAADIDADKCGKRVHDSHAEVLARRALVRFLLGEIEDANAGKDTLLLRVSRQSQSRRFEVRQGKQLVLYTSSAPCGNAVLKRWAKGKKEKYDASWDDRPYQYPRPLHTTILLQSLQQGQIAPLAKREEPSQLTSEGGVPHRPIAAEPQARCDKYGRIAPGTAHLETGFGRTLSCSDKIAFWNILGVQGKELMRLMLNPLYIDCVVVGRKFSRPHLKRALCCRLQDFRPERFPEVGSEGNAYRLNHPAILCTGLKFDNGTLTQTTNASFQETTCVSWTLHDDSADLIDGLNGTSISFDIALVSKHSLNCKMEQLSNTTSVDERVELYRRIKLSLRRLKMFKFINDKAYAELMARKKQRRNSTSKITTT